MSHDSTLFTKRNLLIGGAGLTALALTGCKSRDDFETQYALVPGPDGKLVRLPTDILRSPSAIGTDTWTKVAGIQYDDNKVPVSVKTTGLQFSESDGAAAVRDVLQALGVAASIIDAAAIFREATAIANSSGSPSNVIDISNVVQATNTLSNTNKLTNLNKNDVNSLNQNFNALKNSSTNVNRNNNNNKNNANSQSDSSEFTPIDIQPSSPPPKQKGYGNGDQSLNLVPNAPTGRRQMFGSLFPKARVA